MDLPAAWALHAKTMNNKNVLTAKGIGKVVKSGASDLVILRDIDLEITRGEAVAVIGASGSGKSTLLAILAGLDTPSAGRVEIDGADLFALDEDARARLRAMQVGFVFQSFQLLPGYTALENVMLPLELADHPEAERLSSEILDRVGLGERLDHYPKHLSGGEQQRVALARAFRGPGDRGGERHERRVLRRPREPGAPARCASAARRRPGAAVRSSVESPGGRANHGRGPAARPGGEFHQHGLSRRQERPRRRQGSDRKLPAARQASNSARCAGRARAGARHRMAGRTPDLLAERAGRLAHPPGPSGLRGRGGADARPRAQRQCLQHPAAP